MSAAQADGVLRLMQTEVDRLQNAVQHLLNSNEYLKQAMLEEDDEDREFRAAIEENIAVIAKYRGQIERLEEELRQLRAGRQPLGGQAIPTEEQPLPAALTAPRQQQERQEGAVATRGSEAIMQDAAGQQPERAQQQGEGGGVWM